MGAAPMSTELNENLRFSDLSQDEQASFRLIPPPAPYRFAKDFCFYKWTEFGLVNPKNRKITQYWFPWTSFKLDGREIPGFKELRMRYRNTGGGVGRPQEFARARGAVTEQWNAMTSILKVQLLEPVWGIVGLINAQRAYEDPEHPATLENVLLIGGDYQLCVPNLTPKEIRRL
jgi:hypothetical protein